MAIRTRRTTKQTPVSAAESPASISLAQAAIDALTQAAQVAPAQEALLVEERNVWQPDTWLLQRCWQALADAGAGEEALTVAAMAELRSPLAPFQVLYRVALQAESRPDLAPLVAAELARLCPRLFSPQQLADPARQVERLLLAAASSALIGDAPLGFACLERLDQLSQAWQRVFGNPDALGYLAVAVAHLGLHPLTTQLIASAPRRFEDAGIQFIHQIMVRVGPRLASPDAPRRDVRLAQRCVETLRYATLGTLQGRRLAAAVFGQMGLIDDVLAQLTTIANVQEARRESGYHAGSADPHFLRQVKRPSANPDVDFQVYTLQEAIKAMPLRHLPRERRIALADRLAMLAIRSDGWTAAGAVHSLIQLGALKYAADIVGHIAENDPTRSEGIIELVRGLLQVGEYGLAAEQVEQALSWLRSFEGRNAERATIWGLAEAYLQHGMPEMALRLLQERQPQPGMVQRLRRLLRNGFTDDDLRDNRLRLLALLQHQGTWTREARDLFQQLRRWAPRLLDGEALISFYVDGLLRPLLQLGMAEQALALLPAVQQAVSASSGDKHAVQVAKVARLLADLLPAAPSAQAGEGPTEEPAPEAMVGDGIRPRLAEFLQELWLADAQKGIWQAVHGVEGALPLLLRLEGSQAVVAVAQAAATDGALWTREAR